MLNNQIEIKKFALWSSLLIYSTLVAGCDVSQLAVTSVSAKITTNISQSTSSQPSVKRQFPKDVGWIDVKKDYGAKGDSVTNDTQAIISAINSANSGDYTRPTIIYFPAGTYAIDDWLVFPQEGAKCCVSFQGQGQGQTIIKLQNNNNKFGNVDNPRPIIKTRGGNIAFRNYIRDLTINSGVGNPGATGIDYITNNRGAIKNVNIISEDGTGVAGISMARDWPGPSLIKNVTIKGFNYGIYTRLPIYGMTLEQITLQNQQIAGIYNRANSLAIRGLTSVNSVPVLQNENSGLVIIVDGEFSGGSNKISAIENNAFFYGRNISSAGYVSAIQNQGMTIDGMSHSEYLSHQTYSLFGNDAKSLNLSIEETPDFHDNDLNNWANVQNYPSIQAAMNSGKSTIYFPRGEYQINKSISIPPTVRKIVGFESFINLNKKNLRAILKVDLDSSQPLIIEGLLFDRTKIEHSSPRTLAIKHTKGAEVVNSPQAGKLFLEDVQMHLRLEHPQTVWARQLNAESLFESQTKLLNNGGNWWILGLKTEGKGTVLKTTSGGKTELLGNLVYPVHEFKTQEAKQAAFINRDSSHSLIYSISSASNQRMYPIQVREIHQGQTKLFPTQNMPGRVMPLFVGSEKPQ